MSPERINELLAEVIEQARALGIPVSEDIVPEVRLNRRATGRFGCCIRRAGIYTIELSERLILYRVGQPAALRPRAGGVPGAGPRGAPHLPGLRQPRPALEELRCTDE